MRTTRITNNKCKKDHQLKKVKYVTVWKRCNKFQTTANRNAYEK